MTKFRVVRYGQLGNNPSARIVYKSNLSKADAETLASKLNAMLASKDVNSAKYQVEEYTL